MNTKSDFSTHGYQLIQELGRNREGGRITWLASNLATNQNVVIKQYEFAQLDSTWSGFKAHEQEIKVLQGLNHPYIPQYLGAFNTTNGFCLVQKYIDAPSLRTPRSFAPEEIKQIAIKVLEILVYLQQRIPCIIHRDIKPDNILVDEELNVYLIDFGFARIGNQEISVSSVFMGSPGFIPPEQLIKPTKATDLYALGVTLICLLTGTKSTHVQDLMDSDDLFQIKFRHLLPQLSLRFLNWLDMMVQPKLKERFNDAQQALATLTPIDVIRCPQVELSRTVFGLKANNLSETLKERINIENAIPDTLLTGKWEVAPHPHDPPSRFGSHSWISITPNQFSGNKIECDIQIKTQDLMADKLYQRQLFLHTNAYPEIYAVSLKIQTAAIPNEIKITYSELIWSFLTTETIAIFLVGFIPLVMTILANHKIALVNIPAITSSMTGAMSIGSIGLILGALGGGIVGAIWNYIDSGYFQTGNNLYRNTNRLLPLFKNYNIDTGLTLFFGILATIIGGIFGAIVDKDIAKDLISIFFNSLFSILMASISVCLIGGIVGLLLNLSTRIILWLILKNITDKLSLFAAASGACVGIGFVKGFLNPLVLSSLAIFVIPFLYTLVATPMKRNQLINKYRESEQKLIRP